MTALDEPPGTLDALGALPRTAVLGRIAAALAVCAAAVHLLLLDTAELGSLLMVAMALACLPCAWHLWRHPTPGVWKTTAVVDAAMLLLHAQMLAGDSHHAHAPGTLMWTGFGLVTSQLVLAGAGALRR